MKKIRLLLIACLALMAVMPQKAGAQSIADDLEQLSLDYQKLAGLKSILKQMYQGYEVVNKGFNAVKDVSKGNFSLHQAFLDGLLVVSPTVRKYPRVRDIISDQYELVTEYKSAYSSFRKDKHFNPDEISYMTDVYNSLVSRSLHNLDELSMVMTDSQLRMSDHERLQAIDRIYKTGHDQLSFLRQFNDHTQSVASARANESSDQNSIKKLYGIQ